MKNIVLKITYSLLIRQFLKLIVGVKFDKATFLKNQKQFIIVANHNSHLDTMSVLASVPSCVLINLKPVAAADHFGKTKLKAKLTEFFVNSLLIQRKRDKANPTNDPINKMIKALDDGNSLLVFPEGTRGKPEIQQALKPGVAILLKNRPEIAYVPVYIKGLGKALPKQERIVLPYNSSLIYGKPTKIKSTEIADILHQIESDFINLSNKPI